MSGERISLSNFHNLGSGGWNGAAQDHKLVSEGVDVNGGVDFPTALCRVACIRDVEITRFLCEYGARANSPLPFDSALHIAGMNGHADFIVYLIEEWGASLSPQCEDGQTVFDKAIAYLDVVRVLLSYNCDIVSSPNTLCLAARRGYIDTVKVLVEHGVDVNAKYATLSESWDNVLTPLMIAVLKGELGDRELSLPTWR